MKVLWYWPWAKAEDVVVAEQVGRAGDRITVQVIDRPGGPGASDDGVTEIVPELPDVTRTPLARPRWAADRAATYRRRAALRRRAAAGADLVHVHFANPFTDPFDLARGRWPPVVLTVHDVLPHVRRLPAPVERRLLRSLYQRPQRLVVHHRYVADRLVAEHGIRASVIDVVELPVIPLPPGPEQRDPGLVLFLGALRPNKGLDTLAAAWPRLQPHRDAHLVVAGGGDEVAYQPIAALAQVDPSVVFGPGWVSAQRKAALHRRASVVVLPYTSFSGQSGVLADAYAAGCPVVVTDVGALGAVVRADGSGAVVPPGDPGALAQAIAGLLDDPARHEAAAAGAARGAALRTPERFGRELRAVYDSAAGLVAPFGEH